MWFSKFNAPKKYWQQQQTQLDKDHVTIRQQNIQLQDIHVSKFSPAFENLLQW
jgi:hypothetical protein